MTGRTHVATGWLGRLKAAPKQTSIKAFFPIQNIMATPGFQALSYELGLGKEDSPEAWEEYERTPERKEASNFDACDEVQTGAGVEKYLNVVVANTKKWYPPTESDEDLIEDPCVDHEAYSQQAIDGSDIEGASPTKKRRFSLHDENLAPNDEKLDESMKGINDENLDPNMCNDAVMGTINDSQCMGTLSFSNCLFYLCAS